MKRGILCLIFGVLLVSFIGFVVAEDNETETPSCDSDNLNLCLDETNCTDSNGFWYDDVCNEDNETEQGNQNKFKGERKTTFTPWQKRNDSVCLDGCKCVGAVVTCPTETGKIITIGSGRSGNIITITVDKTEVDTELELEQEETESGNKTKLKAKLTNGKNAEIKIMPDTASETALNKLRIRVCSEENNCQIELKEIGKGDEEKQLAYEMQIERHSRILGIFQKKMQVQAQVDAENGEVIKVKKPWWAFLASEPAEE